MLDLAIIDVSDNTVDMKVLKGFDSTFGHSAICVTMNYHTIEPEVPGGQPDLPSAVSNYRNAPL